MNKDYEIIQNMLWERGYEISGKIGEGGTAQVYRVKTRQEGREFACKVSDIPERLELEGRLLRQMRHPLFPMWKEYFEAYGRGMLIMEYVAGSGLDDHLKRRRVFSQRETVRIAIELADGLACLHECTPPVIYRDIKPSNIILQQNGRARLLDLGAAAVPEGWRVGTAGYAAPEQGIGTVTERLPGRGNNRDQTLQPVCDVFSLGMLMYSMLTGYDPLSDRENKREDFCYGADVRPGVEEIIARCIRESCEERIPGMRELMRELSAYYDKTPLQMTLRDLRKKHCRNKIRYTKNIWLSEHKA